MTITRQTALWTVRGGLAVGAAVLLAACGSSANNASGGPAGFGGEGGGQGFGGGQGGFGPGASGVVGAVSGSTAQVQNAQLGQQVAVTWTASTKFTQQVSAARSIVTVGSCVTVTAPRTSATSSPTPTERPTAITAATVRVTAATNGSCGGGAGRFGGQRPSGAPSGFGTQGGQPGGGQGRPGGFRSFGAFGKVTAVSPSGFTVESDLGGQATTTTVTTTASTTYSTTSSATAAAVKDGVCLQASGNADSTGAITATRIALSQPVDGACTGGFGPRG
jgi:hypothetical protein